MTERRHEYNGGMSDKCLEDAVVPAGEDENDDDLMRYEINTQLGTSQLLLLGKFEYGGGPIFKVVLEC